MARFGELVLDDVSIEIPGGVTAVIGGNGAGKTTLLGLISGDLAPDGGVVRNDRTTGVVEERQRLPADVTPAELTRHVAEVYGARRAAARRQAQEALDQVGLGEERLRRTGTLSIGVQRRVALAVALVHQPALLVLDEPVNGLDAGERQRFLTLVRRLSSQATGGIDVIVSAHDRADLGGIEDTALVVGNGTVDVLERLDRRFLVARCSGPLDPVVRELRALGLRPRVDGAVIRLPDTLRARDGLHRALLRTATPVLAIDVEVRG